MADGQIVSTERKAVRLADYSKPAFAVERVSLDFDLDALATKVRAILKMRRDGEGPVVLDGRGLKLLSVTLDGEVLGDNRYTVAGDRLTIPEAPDAFTLETVVEIDPSANTELSGLYMSGAGFFTQCEPEGFRKITYFPDRPDVMARYDVTLRADKAQYPVLLSNGNKVSEGEDGARHWATWEDPHPKPSYLFALVAADLVAVKDAFVTRSGKRVELGIYVQAGDEGRCGHAMTAVKKSMAWDEERFGLEYDLDVFNIAAVSDFNAGAMENKGLNIFNTAYVLASPETATDADFQGVERVIAHEYFHNWTGDRVTCRDWFQLSLKEGLTVFRDQEYMGDQFSAAVKRIADVRMLRTTQFRDDAGPLAHPVRPASYLEINNFYTTTIYEKGAEVVRMYQTLMGREAFRKGFDTYIERNDNSAATVEDFFDAMQSATDIDLAQFMRWYEQAGTPEITFDEAYDAAAKKFTLTLRQETKPTPGQTEKKPFLMPVAIGLLDEAGSELHAETLVFDQADQSFVFEGIETQPVASLFRNFSAPVKVKGLSRERLAFLAAHDTDLFNRWDSLQQYATAVLLDDIAAHQAGRAFELDAGLRDGIAAILTDAAKDPAFAADAMLLPNESLLADAMDVVDPDAISAVRKATRVAIGAALKAEFTEIYELYGKESPDDLSGQAIGGRALKNHALSYLAAAGEAEGLVAAQFKAGANMTDTLSALGILVETPGEARDAALAAFYDVWKSNPLVLDKWFAVQARSGAEDTLERVRALTKHADFDLKNPNRVRSLIGAFAGNQARFHDASGDGYRLVADMIIALDAKNPQIAARLCTVLGNWRRFEAGRQELLRENLERIMEVEKLSHNSYEMASKALA
jgi:aminopeptidase N